MMSSVGHTSDIFYLLGRYIGGLVIIHAKVHNPCAVTDLHRAMGDLMVDPKDALAIISGKTLTVSRYWCTDQPAVDHNAASEIHQVLHQNSPSITLDYRNGQVKYYNSSFKPLIPYKPERIININYIFADYE